MHQTQGLGSFSLEFFVLADTLIGLVGNFLFRLGGIFADYRKVKVCGILIFIFEIIKSKENTAALD